MYLNGMLYFLEIRNGVTYGSFSIDYVFIGIIAASVVCEYYERYRERNSNYY
mgnify:CR=1 FL=1